MMKRLIVLSALALPLLFVSAPSEAQNAKSQTVRSSQSSDAAIAARQKCFAEAQAQVPADPDPNITAGKRTPVYMNCARRMGVRP